MIKRANLRLFLWFSRWSTHWNIFFLRYLRSLHCIEPDIFPVKVRYWIFRVFLLRNFVEFYNIFRWKLHSNRYFMMRYTICPSLIMGGFTFDAGGRRCIRPILEKYQQGKELIIFNSFIKHCNVKMYNVYEYKLSSFRQRRKWRVHR